MKKVIDSGVFMNTSRVPKLEGELYMSPEAWEEVISSEASRIIEIFATTNHIAIQEPDERAMRRVHDKIRELGQENLSTVDITLLALAVYLDNEVELITDDYGMRNIAHALRIKSYGMKTTGGKNLRKYKYLCSACGETRENMEDECKICGSNLFRRKRLS